MMCKPRHEAMVMLKQSLSNSSLLLFSAFINEYRGKPDLVSDQTVFEILMANLYACDMYSDTRKFHMDCLSLFITEINFEKKKIDFSAIPNLMAFNKWMEYRDFNRESAELAWHLCEDARSVLKKSQIAYESNLIEAIDLLVNTCPSFDINVQNHYGWTPLMLFANCGSVSGEEVKRLVALGADFNVMSHNNGNALDFIDLATPFSVEKYLEAIRHCDPTEDRPFTHIEQTLIGRKDPIQFKSFQEYVALMADLQGYSEFYEQKPAKMWDSQEIFLPEIQLILDHCKKHKMSKEALNAISTKSRKCISL